MIDTFSVYQFFEDGSQEQVRHAVPADEAAKAYAHYTQSVGARLGTTVRVIVTDDGDSIVLEWEFGKGHTFPKGVPHVEAS
jgi:hypothetical protein